MLANTGTVSFVLYFIFIGITVLAIVIAFYYIKKGTIEQEKLDKMIELFKYAIVTIAIATVTLVVTDLFKEREQDVKELEYFDKYVDDVKKVDGIQERLQLSKYLSIVAPNGEMKKSWEGYYKIVEIEYVEYLSLKNKKQNLDTIKTPSQEQIIQKEKIQEEIEQKESPLASYKKSNENTLDLNFAKLEEEKGFDFLLKKDINNAISSFMKSENAYNRYHMTYEISKYLRSVRNNLANTNSNDWEIAYKKIAKEYSYGMPETIKIKLQQNQE